MTEKNIYRPYQIVMIVVFSMVVNLVGRVFADALTLPLWLDSFGTFLTCYLLGPWCGIMVGVSVNILHGLINPTSFLYALTSIGIGFVVGHLAYRGWMETLLKTMTLSVLVTVVCVILSCVINFTFWGGDIGNVWGQGIVDMLATKGVPFHLRVIIGQFYLDFLDKVITLCAVHYFVKIYRISKKHLPSFLKFQPVEKTALLLLPAFFLLAPQKATAQTKKYNSYVHVTYNKTNGLPGGKANDIVSTNDGILWIGTYEGLYRHNGHEFRFMNDLESIKAVRCLYVDDEGRLFVGTNDNGLSIVINERVANILEEKDGLPSDSIRCITRGANGLYFVGTAEETAVLSVTDGLSIRSIISEIKGAKRITADSRGNIAAVTVSGELFLISGTETCWNSKNSSEKYTAVKFNKDGILYATTDDGKLAAFEVSDDVRPSLIFKSETICGKLRHINSIEFFDGVIFLSADNGAAYIENNIFYPLETGSFNNSIDNMTQDYQGNLWFTSSRLGVFKMCSTSFEEIYSAAGLPESVVNSVTKYNGLLYFATDDGLMALNPASNRAAYTELTTLLSNTRIRCLTVSTNDELWICTKSRGLICADKKGKVTTYGKGHVFRNAIELSDGTIAAGGNDGVVFIKDGKIISWLGAKDGFENSVILSLSECNDNSILAGTDGGGLAVISHTEEGYKINNLIKRTDGLSSNVILRTVNDAGQGVPDGGVFVITSNGLCYINFKDSGSYTAQILSNFPYSNNYDMTIREDGNVFVLSSAGIFVVSHDDLLSGKKLEYELLDLKKGLRGSLTANSWNYLDENGNLYLSCDSGVSIINLNTYNKREQSYRIQLKSVLVDGKRHIVQKDIPFVIPAESDKVEILPEIINYSINNPYMSLYMEGVDESPSIMLQSELSSLIYTNLRAGTYKLHICVLDSKGVNVTEKTVYTITKAAHIYDNWWFSLYTFGVFVLAIAWLTWFITALLLKSRMEKQAHALEEIQKQVRMGNETIISIANAVEARDKSTGKHSFRVAEYSVLIAKELGFSEEALDSLYKIGLLHDIGKIGVPDSILNKPSALNDEEYEIMKSHTYIGGEILKDFTLLERVSDGAKYHHERYDGTGYPNGLKGEEIPLNARIIGIADAFDAMTAKRVYRNALDINVVLEELKRWSGTQFDPGLVDIMIDLIQSGKLNIARTIEASTKEVENEK